MAVFAIAALIVLSALATQTRPPSVLSTDESDSAASRHPQLPLSFVPNRGQADGRVLYSAQAGSSSFGFARDRVAITLVGKEKGHNLHLRFLGANPNPKIEADGKQRGRVNYFTANAHQANIPTYGKISYQDLWPGIDLAFRGSGGRLKYEFRVAPGADLGRIRLAYAGAESLSVSAAGALLVETPLVTLRDQAPKSFQRVGGRKVAVESAYTTAGKRYGFEVGAYDHSRQLVIDPGLAYSTFVGGEVHGDVGQGLDVDPSGNVYLTGRTASASFPTTPGAYDTTVSGPVDAFIAKLNAAGTALIYGTYLGGSDYDYVGGIAIDAAGNAYVSGGTQSTNFPTTAGADPTLNGVSDAFVTKLNATGSALDYSTYLGGAESDGADLIEADGAGHAYVAGNTYSSDFPISLGAADSTRNVREGFVTKLSLDGMSRDYSTFVGGRFDDNVRGLAIDGSGSAYVSGSTYSDDFPVTAGAFDTVSNSEDAFVAKLSPGGNAFSYGTYIGGSSSESVGRVAVDSGGNAYVTGSTSSPDFPTTTSPPLDVYADGFLTKLNSSGTALGYSRLMEGSIGFGITVDEMGQAFVTGYNGYGTLVTTPGAYDRSFNGSNDVFLTWFDANGTSRLYSTYLGGPNAEDAGAVELAPDGAPIVLGTAGAGFPTTPGAFDTAPGGPNDAVVVKLDLPTATGHIVVVQDTIPDDPQDFTFTAPDFQSSSFKLDDDSDATRSNTRLLDAAVPGTYSVVQEATPSGWYLGQASCDDGSSPAAIELSANETVTCTFTNSRLYPRPSGATPLRVPLIPAYHVCQLRYANSTHVPPLDKPSCDPPVQASAVLTQSNQGKGQGFARFDVIVGDPNTPGDQADLAIRMNATDVRETAGGGDYAGEVLLSSVLRITDKRNGPLGGGAGTTENFEFSLPVNCAPNTDPNIGSTCSLNSTADTMVPGFAREAQRAIISTISPRVEDAGADGTIAPPPGGLGCPPECGSGDERTFLNQGVFAP